MTKRAILLFLSVILATSVHARDLWGTNYQAALEEAKHDKKMVLLKFTAPDWDYGSIQFDKLVAGNPDFISYARKNLILVGVNFPQRKKQDPNVQDQNLELLKQYGGDHLIPAVILLNSKGEEIARQAGNLPNEVDALIKWIETVKKQLEQPAPS